MHILFPIQFCLCWWMHFWYHICVILIIVTKQPRMGCSIWFSVCRKPNKTFNACPKVQKIDTQHLKHILWSHQSHHSPTMKFLFCGNKQSNFSTTKQPFHTVDYSMSSYYIDKLYECGDECRKQLSIVWPMDQDAAFQWEKNDPLLSRRREWLNICCQSHFPLWS